LWTLERDGAPSHGSAFKSSKAALSEAWCDNYTRTRSKWFGAADMSEPSADDALEQAVRRLERALGQLEDRYNRLTGHAQVGGMFEDDRAKLAAELEASRGRERELAQAGEQASQALGRAIAEIRAALAETQEPQPEKGAA
jgi:uncharacterized protein YukE